MQVLQMMDRENRRLGDVIKKRCTDQCFRILRRKRAIDVGALEVKHVQVMQCLSLL